METAIEKGNSIMGRLGPDGKDTIKSDSSQMRNSLESLRSLLRDTQTNIGKCLCAWDDYIGVRDLVQKWIADARMRVDSEVCRLQIVAKSEC